MWSGSAGIAPDGLPCPPVRCNWVECIEGCGLAGMGVCASGDWRLTECPAFEHYQHSTPTDLNTPEGILWVQELEEQMTRNRKEEQ